jgi:hypothetical protein
LKLDEYLEEIIKYVWQQTSVPRMNKFQGMYVGDIHFEQLRYQANLAMGEHLQYLYHITLQKILT